MRSFCYLALLLFLMPAALGAQEVMNNNRLEKILRQEAEKIEGQPGSWMLYYGERILLAFTDEPNNRMRIFTPIMDEGNLSAAQMSRMLEANFHSALDAKYAVYDGFVVSVFTHPLAELTEIQIADALRQIVRLADTFGETYSSTDLIFGPAPDKETEKRINRSPSRGKRM